MCFNINMVSRTTTSMNVKLARAAKHLHKVIGFREKGSWSAIKEE